MFNVLYITYDGLTDPLGQSQIIPYLKGLSKKGHTFTILSCEKKDRFEKGYKDLAQTLAKHSIDWKPLIYHKNPPVLSTVFDVYIMMRTAIELVRGKKIDIVHCRSYIPSLIGLRLKKKFRIKFIFDMRGFWVDERVEGGIWNLSNPLYKIIYHFFKYKEKKFLENSDHIISLTSKGKEVLHSRKNIKNNPIKISVIPCCADLNHFNYENIDVLKIDNLRLDLKIHKNDFVISYLGSIGTWYMLDEMLDFFKLLLTIKPESKFLFLSNENAEIIFSRLNSKNISKENIIVKNVSYAEVPEYLALSHVSIFFIKPVFSKNASSPTKMGEILGMGIPIICNEGVGDTDRIITDTSSGSLIKNFNEKNYRDAINGLEELLNKDKSKLRAAAASYFSLDGGVEIYEKVYRSKS